jgi:methylmalonyl-CoA mutase N-terminal domain/subunit
VPILYIDQTAEAGGASGEVRRTREAGRVSRGLAALRDAARGTDNTMGPLLECVRAYATIGEMCDALRQVWGEYEEVPSI